jgi:hypothetical protein
MRMKPPSHYEQLATDSMADNDYLTAADHWDSARAASIGHNRRQRYEDAAERCRARAAS